MMTRYRSECAESASGMHNDGRRDGRCSWCGDKVYAPVRRPRPPEPPTDTVLEPGDLAAAYRYIFDPDWGNDRHDT